MIPTKLKPLMNSVMKKINRVKLYLCCCTPCFLYKNRLNKHYNILLNDTLENDTLENDTLENDTLENDTLENDTLENDTLENDTNNSHYNHLHTFSYPHDIDHHSDLYIEYDTYDNVDKDTFY